MNEAVHPSIRNNKETTLKHERAHTHSHILRMQAYRNSVP